MSTAILEQLNAAREEVRERPATQVNSTVRYAGTVEMAEDLLVRLADEHQWTLNLDGIKNAGMLKGTTIPVVSVAAKSFPGPGIASGNFSYYTKSGTLIVAGVCPIDPKELGFTAL